MASCVFTVKSNPDLSFYLSNVKIQQIGKNYKKGGLKTLKETRLNF